MKKLFKNGVIYSLDKDNTVYNSMLIEDGKILKMSKDNDIKEENCEVIDLNGDFLYPSFNDSHMHLVSYGYGNQSVKLMGTTSIEDLDNKILEYIKENNMTSTDWIRGRGWNNDYFETSNELPTRYDLDKVSTTNPLVMIRACGHICVVNSKVLEILGMEDSAPQISGGEIDLDEKGKPLGIFRENALEIVYSKIPELSLEKVKKIIVETSKEMNSMGITSCHSDDFCNLPGSDYKLVMDAYEELVKENKLTVRVYEQSQFTTIEDYDRFLSQGYKTGVGNNYFKIGSLKLLLDGSLGAKTAALNNHYIGEENNYGIMTMTEEKLEKWFNKAKENNMQIAIHCIGDRATKTALDGFEKIIDGKDHRHGIVHCQITDLPLLERIAKTNTITYVQPIFLDYDRHIVKDRVGEELERTSYNWKTMIDLGIHTSFGTDAPVESFNPFHNIYEAVTRKDLKGEPEEGFLIDQAVSVEEALRAYTIEGAYASFEEDIKGSLETGKLADFIVMEEDIFQVAPESIKDLSVKETYLEGKKVYSKIF